MKICKCIVMVVLVSLCLTACGGENAGKSSDAILGEFLAYDLELNEVTEEVLADYKLTMVNVWATFCGPCINEMPALGDLHEKYEAEGFQVIGIVTDVVGFNGSLDTKQVELAYEIIDKTGADYLHLVPTEDLHYAKLKDVSVVPETFFVDKNGKQVGDSYLGARSRAEWEGIILNLLGEIE